MTDGSPVNFLLGNILHPFLLLLHPAQVLGQVVAFEGLQRHGPRSVPAMWAIAELVSFNAMKAKWTAQGAVALAEVDV